MGPDDEAGKRIFSRARGWAKKLKIIPEMPLTLTRWAWTSPMGTARATDALSSTTIIQSSWRSPEGVDGTASSRGWVCSSSSPLAVDTSLGSRMRFVSLSTLADRPASVARTDVVADHRPPRVSMASVPRAAPPCLPPVLALADGSECRSSSCAGSFEIGGHGPHKVQCRYEGSQVRPARQKQAGSEVGERNAVCCPMGEGAR